MLGYSQQLPRIVEVVTKSRLGSTPFQECLHTLRSRRLIICRHSKERRSDGPRVSLATKNIVPFGGKLSQVMSSFLEIFRDQLMNHPAPCVPAQCGCRLKSILV